MMKLGLGLSALLLYVAAAPGNFAKVRNGEIEGAIVPPAYFKNGSIPGVQADGYWTPQAKEIEAAESRLREVLERAVREPTTLEPHATTPLEKKAVSSQLAEILHHYTAYRRQYVGLTINGHHQLYLNSFSQHDSPAYYTKNYVFAMDGGSQYWQICFAVESGTFNNLTVNGSG